MQSIITYIYIKDLLSFVKMYTSLLMLRDKPKKNKEAKASDNFLNKTNVANMI